MKLLIFLISVNTVLNFEDKQSFFTNEEIKEVLKCFGDLNLEEGCVICNYITQKICKSVYN